MSRDTSTPQAWAALVRLWLFAMEHDQVREAAHGLRAMKNGEEGYITRLRWIAE